jgi:hypothetical protein
MGNSKNIPECVLQEQLNRLDAIRGTKGARSDLARQVDALGFEVRMDSDNERSELVLQGAWAPDGSDIVVGEIIGDADAEIV